MAIMSDKWIREQALNRGMIEPFEDRQKRDGVISYGLSSYGYDARVSREFKIFTDQDGHFEIVGLPGGQYAILTTKDGYDPILSAIVPVGEGEANNVNLQTSG